MTRWLNYETGAQRQNCDRLAPSPGHDISIPITVHKMSRFLHLALQFYHVFYNIMHLYCIMFV